MSLHVSDRVATALAERRPVVALESTVVTHGLPYPQNRDLAFELERVVRARGAEPATVAVEGGRLVVGLEPDRIEAFAATAAGGPRAGQDHNAVDKATLWNLAALVASGGRAGTTVAVTLHAAALAGIEVFATGGIGGVHRRAPVEPGAPPEPLDVSADLAALARYPVVTVCAGPKSILDVPATLERLETLGVALVGYGCDHLPGFHARSSGLPVPARADDPAAVAAIFRAQRELRLPGGLLVGNPVDQGIPPERLAGWLETADEAARAAGLRGKDTTPFLLRELAERSRGATVDVNLELLKNNANLAARVAAELAEHDRTAGTTPTPTPEAAGIQR